MNSRDEQADQERARRSPMTRQLFLQYTLTILGFVAGLFLVVLLGRWLCSRITWQPDNPIYIILNSINRYLTLWFVGIILIGWNVITYRYLAKLFHYLDEIVAASKQLAKSAETPIVLSGAMKNVQDELNLTREQVLRNAMAAKEAEQKKNDLIVYLAHDLKTPLTSVIGYLSLLRDEPQISLELRARYTGIALEKAERLEDLINEFFDITRFNLTTLSLEPECVNLTRMLEQITYEFNPVLVEKDLHWDLQLVPDIRITCDPDKLERVFDNLFRNAVSYSYKGSNIHVSLKLDNNGVLVRVQNHGKTIPPEKLSRIFEQFFRLDSSRASSTGGAGLGLAIAKEIVELHGGSIAAESADESITFTVRLPADCQKIV